MNYRQQHTEPYPPSVREDVFETLRLLASPDAQVEYQRNVPIADVSGELLCQWFDDRFRPNDSRLRALFSDAEWSGLLAFHSTYGEIAAKLPATLPPINELVWLPLWLDVTHAAKDALKLFPGTTSIGGSGA